MKLVLKSIYNFEAQFYEAPFIVTCILITPISCYRCSVIR